MSTIETLNKEISLEISKPDVQKALLLTTFKGLDLQKMKQAMLEGMMRGFKFKDFLEKNVYAIPFRDGYSLITSIDYSRKIAMNSGLVGKSAPVYEYDKNGHVISCTITIKRKVDGYVGEYTATADLREYSTGKNLWATKPKTMLAKVAEMHALRSAFPEQMAKQYVEEEIQKEIPTEIKLDDFEQKLKATKSLDELSNVWVSMPQKAKSGLKNLKDELKKQYENSEIRE